MRVRRLVSVVAAATMATLGSVSPAAAGQPAPPPEQRQAAPVEVPELTTEEKIVHRQPDGSMVATLTVEPVRVKQDGRWNPVDTTLVRRPDGTIGPRAVPADIAFSPGGDKPLVRLGKADRSVALTWPRPLPAPAVGGDTATYVEVLPGVDLVMRAEAKGYTQRLVIKNAEAGRNPALHRIKFGMDNKGVTVKQADSGALQAVDDQGNPVFEAAPPSMWDRPGEKTGKARKQVPVKVELADKAMALLPNAALLTDPDAQFPISIDPDMKVYSKSGWTKVFSGKPTTSYWNGANDVDKWAKVGYCGFAFCNGIDITRAYFAFDTSSLTGGVTSVTLKTTMVYSPSCGNGTGRHQLYRASGSINSGTTWNSRPSGTLLSTKVVGQVYSGCSGYKKYGFSAGTSVSTSGTSTYFLKADYEDYANRWDWRKYDAAATTLEVRYNHAPSKPTSLSTDPPLPAACHWCDGVRYMGKQTDNRILLKAKISDPNGDQVKSHWAIHYDGAYHYNEHGLNDSGLIRSHYFDIGAMNGKTVSWRVRGIDVADLAGEWADGPGPFKVDDVAPGVPPTVSGVLYQQDNLWHGGKGISDTFTLGAAGVTDVDHYEYHWTNCAPGAATTKTVLADKLGGNAALRVAVPCDGATVLYVRSVDRAGNVSPETQYAFKVRPGNGAMAHWKLEGNTADSAYPPDADSDKTGQLSGDTGWVPGAVGLGLRIGGGGQMAAWGTRPPPPATPMKNILRTDAAFTVSAWVRPDTVSPTGAQTVLSQLGTSVGGFQLGVSDGRWSFAVPQSDSTTAAVDTVSAAGATAGVWTHVTGSYSTYTNLITLYVNGVKVEEKPHTTRWNATGEFRVGNTATGGVSANPFTGVVDEVKLWDRAMGPTEASGLVSQDNVQVAHWPFDDVADGGDAATTTAGNEVVGGADIVLNGGAKLGPGKEKGGLVLDGVDDFGTTPNAPMVRTDRSFTVSAWVNTTRPGITQAALSQDATRMAGFALGYEPAANDKGHFVFLMPQSDSDTTPHDKVVSADIPRDQLDDWYHLTGTYDAATGKILLYVNATKVGETARAGVEWTAAGAFQIGRMLHTGASGTYWQGSIDAVRVYSRAIAEAEVRGIFLQANSSYARWPLDGSGDKIISTGGQPGTLAGDTSPTWTPGQSQSPDPTDLAVKLDATKKQHIVSTPSLDTRQSFAVTAWARLDELGGTPTVVSEDGDAYSSFTLGAAQQNGVTVWAFTRFGTTGSVTRAFGSAVQEDTWTHLAGMYDKELGVLELWVNGKRSGSVAYPGADAWDHTGNVVIGAREYGGVRDQFFTGAIDDVEAYRRVLFPEEIVDMYGGDLSMLHNWPLNEAGGTAAADAVAGLGGTVTGGAQFTPGRSGNAIKLDGVDDSVGTAPLTSARTDQSFTVSAWVYLDGTRTTASDMVAVSVDGARQSKFRLGHRVDVDGNYCETPDNCGAWVFEMPVADTDNITVRAVVGKTGNDVNRWVHLVGVYDQPHSQILLYVDGMRIGTAEMRTPWTHPTTNGNGGVRIGRGKVNGEPGQYFAGGVDDPRLYFGALNHSRVTALHNSYTAGGGAPLPETIAGHWKLDGDGTDASGRDTPVTLAGAPGWRGGRVGSTMWLNGSDQFAETSQQVLDTSDAGFTVSAWAYLDDKAANRTVVGQDAGTGNAFRVYYDKAKDRWAVSVTGTSGAATVVPASQAVRIREWTQLTASYEPATRQVRLYVNGVLVTAQLAAADAIDAAGGHLSIGRTKINSGNAEFFLGGIDDVRAYTKTVTPEDVRAIHGEAPAVTHDSWRFNDGTARDYSVRDVNLTEAGGASYTDDGLNGKALKLASPGASASGGFGASTRDSFTMAAWVKLTAKGSAPATVVSQYGARSNGFALQYRPAGDNWGLVSYKEDTDTAESVVLQSIQPAALNRWTHLTGVYDHPASQLRLYVDGVLQDTRDGVVMWDAMSGLAVGRGLVKGAPAEFLTGLVDEVQAGQGALTGAEITARATTPAAPGGQLGRYVDAAGERVTASTDAPPTGYRFEATLGMPAPPGAEGTKTLYTCKLTNGDLITVDGPDCAQYTLVGPIGDVYAAQPPDQATIPIYRCNTGPDHFDSRDGGCGGATNELVLGYALAYAPMGRYVDPVGHDSDNGVQLDHWSTVDGVPPGYRIEGPQGYLPLSAQTGTVALRGCRAGVDQFVSVDAGCEGKVELGVLGRLFAEPPMEQPDGSQLAAQQVFRCVTGGQKFLSLDDTCEGQQADGSPGYLLSSLPGDFGPIS